MIISVSLVLLTVFRELEGLDRASSVTVYTASLHFISLLSFDITSKDLYFFFPCELYFRSNGSALTYVVFCAKFRVGTSGPMEANGQISPSQGPSYKCKFQSSRFKAQLP